MKKFSERFPVTILSIFAIVIFFFVPARAVFAQVPISVSIPGSYINSTSTSPGGYIANFYQFALLIGGVLALAVVVYGGILYMMTVGNPSGQSEAKEWLMAALWGILLLGGAYLVLNTINPQLVNLNLPSLGATGQTSNQASVAPSSGGTGGGSAGTCKAPTAGPCSVSALESTCLGNDAAMFSGICGHESGGAASVKSGTDYCVGPNGEKESVSVGLFQVNLTNSWKQSVDGQNCGSAFAGQAVSCSGNGPCTTGHNGTGQACQVTNMQLYKDCVAAAQDVNNNIAVACQLSNGGSNLGPWKADAKACGF